MTAAFELANLSVRRGATAVLDGVDLSVGHGEIVALLGPSGAGKSTVVRVALGLMAPTTGTVAIDGRLASRDGRVVVPPEERGMGVVFQDLALWPHLTVRENLAFALHPRRLGREEADARISSLLDELGIAAMDRRHPGELSGGERQRVAIARALVGEPNAVLLDEPLANLDLVLKTELLSVFQRALRRGRTSTLYVTHDPREAAALADRVVVLETGRITHVGSSTAIASDPRTPFGRAIASELVSPLWATEGRAHE
jgi:iron(III) transport system ATP-binding protein